MNDSCHNSGALTRRETIKALSAFALALAASCAIACFGASAAERGENQSPPGEVKLRTTAPDRTSTPRPDGQRQSSGAAVSRAADSSGRLDVRYASGGAPSAPSGAAFVKPHIYFNPLKHIYMYDIFAIGNTQGWGPFESTFGDPYVGSLPCEKPPHALTRGGLSGQQVLIQPATHANKFGRVIKRGSWIWASRIRYECWFTFKNFGFKYPAKGANYGAFRFDIDSQMGTGAESDRRWFSVRWNSASATWEYSCGVEDTQQWKPLPGDAKQELTWNQCYKYDWLYARMDIHLGKHEYVEFQCANRVWDLRGLRPCKGKKYCGESNAQEADVLNNLINFTFSANKGDAEQPSYLLIDSAVVSADE